MKKINLVSIFMLLVVIIGLTGCSEPIMVNGVEIETTEQAIAAVDNAVNVAAEHAYNNGVSSVDISADNEAVVAEALAVVEAEKEALAKELAEMNEAEVAAEIVLSGYVIDDIPLTGTFEDSIDSDDFTKLKYYEVEYNDEKFDVEEVLMLSSDIKPKLNLRDLDGEVVVELADEGAITYEVIFDSRISITEDDLEIDFLGAPMKIVSQEDNTITYRLAQEYVGEFEGKEYLINDKVLKILDVVDGDEVDKAYVSVDGESGIVTVGKTEEINGLSLRFEEIYKSEYISFVKFYAGEDVTVEVSNNEEYEADERFEWIIDGNEDGLLSIGLKLVEEKTDDDEVMRVGDIIAFPNGFINVVFSSVNNMELKDVELKVTDDDIRLSFEGKIEVDDERVDDGELVFYMDGETPMYKYEHNGEDREDLENMEDIVMFHDNRELSVKFTDSIIKVFEDVEGDIIVNYRFYYSFDEEIFTETSQDAENINDDDNFRMDNGDLLYKVDFSEEDVDEVSFGLVSDEDVECVLRIE